MIDRCPSRSLKLLSRSIDLSVAAESVDVGALDRLHMKGGALVPRKMKRMACGHSQTYTRMHVAYYGALTTAGTTSLWWCRGKESISFVDCIFNAVSTITATGLCSVPLRDFTPLGLLILMTLMLLGNSVFVSLLPVYARRFQLFRRDRALMNAANAAVKLSAFPRTGSRAAPAPAIPAAANNNNHSAGDTVSQPDRRASEDGGDGCGMCPDVESGTLMRRVLASCCGNSCEDPASPHDLGWLESQALVTLSKLVPIYMFVAMAFGFVAVVCYTSFSSQGSSKIRALYEAQGLNQVQTALFLSISAFSNTGLSPVDENMVPFAAHPLVLVPLAFLALGGNTMFPPFMRFIIWSLSRLKRPDDPQREVYKYLLQFPRRCYTHLFPPAHTRWLVASAVLLNILGLVAFCALEWNSAAVAAAAGSNAGVKLMAGLFQSLNTRSAGMNVLPLGTLSPPLLVLYTTFMCIAAYPVFLSRQHSRLPRSNGDRSSEECESEKVEATDDKKVALQLTRLFTRDSAYIFVHAFLICTVEIRSMNADPLNYSIFSIVFEVVSAYGNVGLSLGYSCEQWVRASANTPYADAAAACEDVAYSFAGKLRVHSKLILVCGMLLGRHRSLPDDLDSAIADVAPSHLCDLSCGRCRRDEPPPKPNPNPNPNFVV